MKKLTVTSYSSFFFLLFSNFDEKVFPFVCFLFQLGPVVFFRHYFSDLHIFFDFQGIVGSSWNVMRKKFHAKRKKNNRKESGMGWRVTTCPLENLVNRDGKVMRGNSTQPTALKRHEKSFLKSLTRPSWKLRLWLSCLFLSLFSWRWRKKLII